MLSFGDNDTDRACNLECVEHLPPVHEFVGPVKIVLMDVPKSVYTKKMWISAAIGFAEMLIGATVMIILFYTLAFKTPLLMNLHIALCMLGFQLFMPAAILMQNSLHGPSSALKQPDRKLQHFFMQVCGLVCGGVGAVLVVLFGPGSFGSKLKSIHCWAGLVTCVLATTAAIMGPAAYFTKDHRVRKSTHAVIGVFTLIASSVCFVIGVVTSKTFEAWTPLVELVYFLIIFCVLYTTIVLIVPVMKLFNKAP